MEKVMKAIGNSLFINGDWREPHSKNNIEVFNPATGEAICEIGYGGVEDALEAVEAADRAFSTWSGTTARERANLLNRAANLIRERETQIAGVMVSETGKRFQEAVGEVRFAADYFQWFAEEIRRPYGQIVPGEAPNKRHIAYAQPAGVALSLTPWNFPVSIQARKLAPALAAGCTVVARGSQVAPLSVIELFRCLNEAGFPKGVINLIHGPASTTTEAMMKQQAVRVVSFTGSTPVGRSIIRQSADQMVRLALELGGNAPFIVFDDADVEKAVEGAMIAKFRNNGQSCIGANRFYAHEKIYDHFVSLFTSKIKTLKVGNPVNPEVDLGPVINLKNKERIEKLISKAELLGAKYLVDTVSIPGEGFYIPPILMENVPEHAALASEEIFGPVAPIHKFMEEDEVIFKANQTDLGLAAYVFTNHLSRSTRMTEALKFGIVGLNSALPSVVFSPMGGVKQSGLGREGGRVGLEEFMDIKYVASEI